MSRPGVRIFTRLSAACVLASLAVRAAAPVATASVGSRGDDDDLVDGPASVPPQVERRAFTPNLQNIHANIDGWIYGNRRGGGNSGPQMLESLLKIKADEVGREASLSEIQKQKLLLAGEGDIRRFVDRVDEVKAKYETTELHDGFWNQVFRDVRPLQASMRSGLFGSGSLFAKTLNRALAPDQAQRYERAEEERTAFQHRARIEMTVMRLDRYLALRESQRQQLARLLLENTRPLPPIDQVFDNQYFGLAQMSRLPEESLKPLFDAQQWRDLQRLFERIPPYMEMMRKNGVNVEDLDAPREKHRASKKSGLTRP